MNTMNQSKKWINTIGWVCESAYWLVILGILVLLSFSSCDKETEPPVLPTPNDSIADVEGRYYPIIKIGNDWWMTENLATTKYRNGDAIELIQNSSENWENGLPAYCKFEDSQLAPGLLYNWQAVNDSRNIAPEGWHVATEDEWKALERHLGMNTEDLEKISWRESGACGDKLKIKGPTGWLQYEGVWGTNESGFSALAGACRLWNGQWANPGLNSVGFWWTATERDSATAYFRNLDHKKSGVFRFYVDKRYGMSVRCVKDK